MNEKKFVYMDNASTTFISKRALKELNRCYKDCNNGNASSQHSLGRIGDGAIFVAKTRISGLIGCENENIVFTSGSTEGNNLAIIGAAKRGFSKPSEKKKVLTTEIEHPSVFNTFIGLEHDGFDVEFVNVDQCGIVDLDDLCKKIDKNTSLVSVMLVNNEVGSVQPIKKISEICKKYGCLLHVDATQAVNSIKINVDDLGVDFLTVSAHKFHGPKGVGFLYVRHRDDLSEVIYGGEQEFGVRPGTYNTPAIAAMSVAFEDAQKNIDEKKQFEIASYFWSELTTNFDKVKLFGPKILPYSPRVFNIVNISFDGMSGEFMVALLDTYGIEVGSGSACSGNGEVASRVLLAMGNQHDDCLKGIRFSFSNKTNKKEIDYVIKCLKEIHKMLSKTEE